MVKQPLQGYRVDHLYHMCHLLGPGRGNRLMTDSRCDEAKAFNYPRLLNVLRSLT